MQEFKNINIDEFEFFSNHNNSIIIDIRDNESFSQSHIVNAKHLSMDNIMSFIEETDKDTYVLIYCYKGYSSQKIANFLTDSGFINVYSLIGGFNAWKTKFK